MTSNDDPELLLDSSAAVPLLVRDHDAYDAVHHHVGSRHLGLAGHANFETYSVLTRFPTPARATAAAAVRLIKDRFPSPRHLPMATLRRALDELAAANVTGGAVYDGLIGLAARAHDIPLVTRDARALGVYRRLGVAVEMVTDVSPSR